MIIQFRPLNTDLAEQSLANSLQFLTHGIPTFKCGSLSVIYSVSKGASGAANLKLFTSRNQNSPYFIVPCEV